MAQREVVFEMENGKNSGVDQIVLYLGEGVNARIKKEVKHKKLDVVEIEIFREENEGEKHKVEVAIKIEKYKFIFKIEEGLNFKTIGEYHKDILANASKPEK